MFYLLGLSGAVLQLWGYTVFFGMTRSYPTGMEGKTRLSKNVLQLLKISGWLLAVKLLLQCFSAVPYMADLAYRTTEFIIGYLHWTFLGVVSLALLAFLANFGLLTLARNAIRVYLAGFFITEFLIFYKEMALWLHWPLPEHYYLLLLSGSVLFPVATGMLFFKNLNPRFTWFRRHQNNT